MKRFLPFLAAYLGMLIFGICMLTLGSVMPFLDQALHLNELAKGSLATILPIGILAGSVVFGPIVDRYSYRILLSLSAAVTASGILLVGYASRITELQLAFFLIGLGGGSLNGTTSALISFASMVAATSVIGVSGPQVITPLCIQSRTRTSLINGFSYSAASMMSRGISKTSLRPRFTASRFSLTTCSPRFPKNFLSELSTAW